MSLSKPLSLLPARQEKRRTPLNPVDLYLHLLSTFPLSTKCTTAGLLGAVSVFLAQYLQQRDVERKGGKIVFRTEPAVKQFALGFAVRAPIVHFWFNFMEWVFKGWDSKSFRTVLMKIAVEQALFQPFFAALNMILAARVEGCSMEDIQGRLKASFGRVLKTAVRLWAVVGLVQYRFVPIKLRVFVANLVALFWNAYLILQADKKNTSKRTAADERRDEETENGSSSAQQENAKEKRKGRPPQKESRKS
uniref:Peroxisomal membrane protein MPV17 n=2 Tax=Chromera velia TaxID=505693 RepID=A0A2K8DQH1_9ALVE|nr:Peroxisomal membrane protein MPV17 [Chromera velia]|mmetsp:Transcript_9868/g.19135  ORF Transcript_9868/g.19135 Transcript_9868/m.19135 type:complete len:249 (-) Transcript_9868:649-1395(-)|eukprot:Cvel_29764.t1-p1 / transcript=Cvel_29764.t1 / gene=Cvel_29764 / organism=Chromera_velia_CCMP2878 / gene_product=Peroxisomal membrane protein 2, putative / transcript_product=Peroxisomal membrane protein 2, putative / location=Cvel_scaffold4134:163-2606(-) / protein_length=248 / sequence_SO=supercontig / SO=protein_coding / is_pseudo=false